MRMQIRADTATLVEKDDGIGVLFSQYGFQHSYDSQSQTELGVNDDNVNPMSVQGWNGVAIFRTDTT